MAYEDFKVSFIPNRFGAPNSILVPSLRIALDSDNGHGVEQLFVSEEQRFNFEIYGQEFMFGGEVCVPGEWNYCYTRGKFFHMEKIKSNGFIDGQEWFFYTIIYDDGQNDGLTGNVYLKGTIGLTGDKDLVRQHIVQTKPLLNNVNNFRYLNGVIGKDETTRILIPKGDYQRKGIKAPGISSYDIIRINEELKKLRLGEPERNRLIIPFLYRTTPQYHWKYNVISSFTRMADKGVYVFDIAADHEQRKILENVFKSPEIYVVSTLENKTYNYAKTHTPSKYVTEIDLSRITDLVELNPVTLTPKYTSVESTPSFSLQGLCNKMLNRLGWSNSLLNRMEYIVTEVFARTLGNILNTETSDKKKVFKNVTLAPIKRDITGIDYSNGVEYLNPVWLSKIDSLYPFLRFHRNFIYTRPGKKDNIVITGSYFTKSDSDKDIVKADGSTDISADKLLFGEEDLTPESELTELILLFLNSNDVTDVEKIVKALEKGEADADLVTLAHPKWSEQYGGMLYDIPRLAAIKDLTYGTGLQFIMPTHQFKLTSPDGEIDFTREEGIANTYIAILPDYERKTHVLAKNVPISFYSDDKWKWGIKFSDTDVDNPLRGEPIIPFSMHELLEPSETSVSDKLKKNLLDEYCKTFHDDICKGRILRELAYGHYTIKYKTWYSTGKGGATATTSDGGSDNRAAANGYRTGISPFYLARVQPQGNNWIQYQVEFTFPFSEELKEKLSQYSDGPDCIIRGEIVNSNSHKGAIGSNFRVGDGSKVSFISDRDKAKIPPNDIIVVWMNPNNHTNWLHDLESAGIITAQIRRRAFELYGTIRDQVFDDREKEEKYQDSDVKAMFDWFYRYGFERPWYPDVRSGGIPTRLHNDTADNDSLRSHNGYPQLSMSFIKPFQGHFYVCHFKFHPTFDSNRFGFSNSTRSFNFEGSKDGLVVVIPNLYAGANSPVPQYTYRVKITEITRDANLAFLGGVMSALPEYDEPDRSKQYGGITWSYGAVSSGDNANRGSRYFKENYLGKENLFFGEFIRREFKTNRTDNPTIMNQHYIGKHGGTQDFKAYSLDVEIPPFMAKFLDPDNSLCEPLHNGKTSNSSNDVDRLQEGKEKIENTASYVMQMLTTHNTWFRIEGTDGYTSVRLNVEGSEPRGDSEMFTTNPSLIKTREGKRWNFLNYKESDIDVLINTSNEINIYGKRIMQKSRYFSEDKILDIGLLVTPLEDPKQSEAATGYKVEMKTEQQDLIRDIIEIPKELVRRADLSIFQRESLIRQISLKSSERESELSLLALEKERFNIHNDFEYSENVRRSTHRIARAGIDIGAGAAKAGMGIFKFWTSDTVEGGAQVARGVADMADAIWEVSNREGDRKRRYRNGMEKLVVKGDLMAAKYDTNRANHMAELLQRSTRIQYPQMNNGLIYKTFNKYEGLNDIYLVQYFPSGDLLKYIKEYYKEYGYELLIRDFECHGADSIKRHLRYINVFENVHPSVRVRSLIEARALNGIFVVDTTSFW